MTKISIQKVRTLYPLINEHVKLFIMYKTSPNHASIIELQKEDVEGWRIDRKLIQEFIKVHTGTIYCSGLTYLTNDAGRVLLNI